MVDETLDADARRRTVRGLLSSTGVPRYTAVELISWVVSVESYINHTEEHIGLYLKQGGSLEDCLETWDHLRPRHRNRQR